MSTTITSLDQLTVIVPAANPATDFSKPITDLGAIKTLLCQLVNDASNAVEEASEKLKKTVKAQALFELYTGSQTCGFIKDVCSLDSVEELIINTSKLVKAMHYIPENEPETNVHIFELALPHGYEGYTENVTIAQAHASRLLQKVHTFYDPTADRVSHVSYEAPRPTSSYHFVVVAKKGKVFMDRWEPGSYFPKQAVKPSGQKVKFGNVRVHGKRETFPILWGMLTACDAVDKAVITTSESTETTSSS